MDSKQKEEEKEEKKEEKKEEAEKKKEKQKSYRRANKFEEKAGTSALEEIFRRKGGIFPAVGESNSKGQKLIEQRKDILLLST